MYCFFIVLGVSLSPLSSNALTRPPRKGKTRARTQKGHTVEDKEEAFKVSAKPLSKFTMKETAVKED